MTTDDFTQALARRVAATRFDELDHTVQETARHCLLDYMAVALPAIDEPLVTILRDEMSDRGGRAQATVFGSGLKLPCTSAARINGTVAHALDFDDVTMSMPGHPSVVLFPAIIALGEKTGATGQDLITAFAAGYDALCMIGEAMRPGHYDQGFHSTATLGAFGAAAACSRLLAQSPEVTAHALAIAAAQAAGLKSLFGTMCKPYQAGAAAAAGLEAASLSARGFTARTDIIECEQGFAATHGPAFCPEKVDFSAPPGAFVRTTLYKYHAACYLTHPGIEAALHLMDTHTFEADQIASATLAVAPICDRVCNIAEPKTGLETKFSLRFTLAMALSGLNTGDRFTYTDDCASDCDLKGLAARITPAIQDNSWPENLARLTLRLRDGRVLEAEHDCGQPASDLQAQKHKLLTKSKSLVGADATDRLANCLQVDAFEDVNAFISACLEA